MLCLCSIPSPGEAPLTNQSNIFPKLCVKLNLTMKPLSKPPFYEYVYALHKEIVDNVRRELNSRKFSGIANFKQ
ncbi:unnamed protein product [Hymenolepis diminuta]|uniref:EthD domain-containing protein n=1 Tax=Hymenolepis diminuta TaxID=6216 RepID=A0A0R3SXQ0_HYMDI|nr:unnamed protein product [Hymenolepis diminuta]